MSTPAATLKATLERHNNAFESLLKLIPAQYYLVNDASEDQAASKYQKHSKKQKLSKQAIKEESKKAKREKLDPANHKSIIDIQNENYQKMGNKGKRRASPGTMDETAPVDIDVDMEDIHGLGGDDAEIEFKPLPESTGIEALREKLHTKMALLRTRGRPAYGEPGDKDDLLEERRRQRAAMRERRRKETKDKIKREEEAKAKTRSSANKQRDKGQSTKNHLLVSDRPSQLEGPQANFTTVAYSSIAGSSKKGEHLKTTADPQQALQQLSARKEKLSSMPEEKRKAVEENEKWTKAEARLEGVKIHDDEVKLKKAAKRKEKAKTKSKATWDTKKEQVQAAMVARQKKREDNLAKRHERRKDKKKGLSKKARPGFEGRTFGRGKKPSNKGKTD